jgi:squalene-associated FAD-dependent desaturase
MEHWVVVGAGWSGLACAVEAAGHGVRVTLVDAAPAAGGRARRVDLRVGERPFVLDNGQHLLIGACSATLALMARLGVDPGAALLARPFALRYPDGWCLSAVRAPAPLHLAIGLLGARRIPWSHRAALAAWVGRQKRAGWQADADQTVSGLVASQPQGLVGRFWRPLCIAAMNAEPEQCSARMFLNLLRLSLGGAEADSNLLLARQDLSATMPDAALAFLAQRGTEVRLRQAAQKLTRTPTGWSVTLRDAQLDADRVVLAVPADSAVRLLRSAGLPGLEPAAVQMEGLEYQPLATVYLRYAQGIGLPEPLYVLIDDPSRQHYGQWVFDRQRIDPAHDSILGVVVGAPALRHESDLDVLCRSACRQLQQQFGLPASLAQRAVIERRATLLPGVALRRPAGRLPERGLYLAGDVADSPFPSTLEGSVRAGLEAAQLAAADGRIRRST